VMLIEMAVSEDIGVYLVGVWYGVWVLWWGESGSCGMRAEERRGMWKVGCEITESV